jgi:hypothetical protein
LEEVLVGVVVEVVEEKSAPVLNVTTLKILLEEFHVLKKNVQNVELQ